MCLFSFLKNPTTDAKRNTISQKEKNLNFCFITGLPAFLKGKATKTNILNYHLKTQEEANGNQYVTEFENCKVQIREVKGS